MNQLNFFKRWLPLWVTLAVFLLASISDYFITQKLRNTTDYMSWLAGLSTLGALLSFLYDKELNRRSEEQKYWHSYMPFLILSSPCDPTQNYCDINILDNTSEFNSSRENIYFSIPNFSNATAYDVRVDFSVNRNFLLGETRSFFIDVIPATDNGGNNLRFLYSKFNLSPESKEIQLDEFDLCGFSSNCKYAKEKHKELFGKLSYQSSPVNKEALRFETIFKVTIECDEDIPEGLTKEATRLHTKKVIRISNIARLEHKII
jgi:hypothetical protein